MKKRYFLTFKTVLFVIGDIKKSFTCEDYEFTQKQREVEEKIKRKLKRIASLASKDVKVINTDIVCSDKLESS